MIILPSLIHHTQIRPKRLEFEPSYSIPDGSSEFWNKIYTKIQEKSFTSPVSENIERYIDARTGYFGFKDHPQVSSQKYFHLGIEATFTKALPIYPVTDGILEYSGYGAINGYYVLLSHPEVVTEDGYVLHSMYCHLKKPKVNFSSYQKMLREVSLGSYPIIPVSQKTSLGISGSSGSVTDGENKLYIQFDFRKYGHTPIVLDPFRILTGEERGNEE